MCRNESSMFRQIWTIFITFWHMPGNFPAHARVFSDKNVTGKVSGMCRNKNSISGTCREIFRHVPENEFNFRHMPETFPGVCSAGKFPGTCRKHANFRHVPGIFPACTGLLNKCCKFFPAHAGNTSGMSFAGKISGTCQNTIVS